MKIFCVFGTRPEAIKMAPVVKRLEERAKIANIEIKICVTAQHREMMDQVLNLFKIVPDYDLNIMESNQTPSQVAAAVISQLEPILIKEKPDWLLIQGDTTTVMAASIVAFYNRVKIGHVEAGLRTYNREWPFPEEINRQIAGVVADYHFAPTETAEKNLLSEGKRAKDILVTGNTVIDALQWVAGLPVPIRITSLLENINKTQTKSPKIILITAHRRENFGQPIINICNALKEIAQKFSDSINIIYPVHLNPNIYKPVHELLRNVKNITLTTPLNYHEFVHLLKVSHLVLTDSGGIQEEAPTLGKPVLVLREVTERPEAVDAGTAKIVGTAREDIVEKTSELLENSHLYNQMSQAVNPYGDGEASDRIIRFLMGEEVLPFKRA